ncbi:MAG: GtrA family protein [Ferruginibacter sp.]
MNSFFNIRLIKFGLVGTLGLAIDFLVTWLCKEKLQLNKYVSNSLGFFFSVFSNFSLNRYWTFANTDHSFTIQLAKFVMISTAGLLINNMLLALLVRYAKKNFYFLKLVVTGIVFFWNYFGNVLFTF